MEHTSSRTVAGNPWRGFHHVALTTPDIDSTVRFYVGVLGMTAGEISASSKRGAIRNCFVYPDAANENGATGIHFFEDIRSRPEGNLADPAGREPGPGKIQHVAFSLPDGEQAAALRERLVEAGVWTSDVIDFGATESLLLLDNNGLMLEATWPKP